MVRSMLYQMVLNDADADDLTQEVFLRVVRGLGQFDGRARFPTWLYRIVMNTARTFLGKKGKSPAHPGDCLNSFQRMRAL
jgi:RNA polymerase sigma-70 factor (ECF subfamily)